MNATESNQSSLVPKRNTNVAQNTSTIEIRSLQFRGNKLSLFSSENTNSVSKGFDSLHCSKEEDAALEPNIAVACRLC